jgi:putative SOS response-associated peptidase YedK
MSTIHNSKKRMPLIINKDMEEFWIDPGFNVDNTKTLLKPVESDALVAWPIGNLINQRNQNRNISELIEKREI